jgi:hypothetical protein
MPPGGTTAGRPNNKKLLLEFFSSAQKNINFLNPSFGIKI